MAIGSEKKQAGNIFETEAAWCDGSKEPLCLPSGTWRTERPILTLEKCTNCGLCYLYCPPQCIRVAEDHFPIDLDFCKGCGICAKECPTGAIVMVDEGEADGSTNCKD